MLFYEIFFGIGFTEAVGNDNCFNEPRLDYLGDIPGEGEDADMNVSKEVLCCGSSSSFSSLARENRKISNRGTKLSWWDKLFKDLDWNVPVG